METDFFQVLSVQDFLNLIQSFRALRAPAARELAQLADAVLAEDIHSSGDLPPFSRSAMDGYAVRAADLFGTGESNPGYLQVIDSIAVGVIEETPIGPGQCMEIVTGAALPPGADAVLMVEYTESIASDEIEVRRTVAPGEHIMFQGEDCRRGERVLASGTRIRAQELGLLGALGQREAAVFPRPEVGIISSGDELVPPDQDPNPGQIRDVNALTLHSGIESCGGIARHFGIVPDRLPAIRSRLQAALEACDLVLISGGSSIGRRDFTIQALQEFPECRILAHGVSISPGKPTILGVIGGKPVVGLPGQVTSVQVVFLVLVQPLIRCLAGEAGRDFSARWPSIPAELARNLASKQGREDYVRVRLEYSSGAALPLAVPLIGKSGLLKTMLQADGLVRIPAEQEGLLEKSEVRVLVFG